MSKREAVYGAMTGEHCQRCGRSAPAKRDCSLCRRLRLGTGIGLVGCFVSLVFGPHAHPGAVISVYSACAAVTIGTSFADLWRRDTWRHKKLIRDMEECFDRININLSKRA